jgi:hypothetical protein
MAILESTRTEARACMARGFAAMAEALIAMDVAGGYAREHRVRSLLRNARGRDRILGGQDEVSVVAEVNAAFKADRAETHRLAKAAWADFLAEWNAEHVRSAA